MSEEKSEPQMTREAAARGLVGLLQAARAVDLPGSLVDWLIIHTQPPAVWADACRGWKEARRWTSPTGHHWGDGQPDAGAGPVVPPVEEL